MREPADARGAGRPPAAEVSEWRDGGGDDNDCDALERRRARRASALDEDDALTSGARNCAYDPETEDAYL